MKNTGVITSTQYIKCNSDIQNHRYSYMIDISSMSSGNWLDLMKQLMLLVLYAISWLQQSPIKRSEPYFLFLEGKPPIGSNGLCLCLLSLIVRKVTCVYNSSTALFLEGKLPIGSNGLCPLKQKWGLALLCNWPWHKFRALVWPRVPVQWEE